MRSIGFLALAAAAAMATSASASVIYDGSGPAASPLYGAGWSNETNDQNFLLQFTLAQAASVDGVSIWAGTFFSEISQGVTVRLRNDVSGEPDSVNLAEINLAGLSSSTPNGDGTSIDTALFAPISLAAGAYWIGLSGNFDLTEASYQAGPVQSPGVVQMSGETAGFHPSIYEMPFQVLGDSTGAVPEPAAWAMMLMGFGGLGAALRRRARPLAA